MSLEEKITQDYIVAMKERDALRSMVVSTLRSQIKNVKIDRKLEKVSDEEIIAIIKKQLKQRQDSISQFTAGGRMDLVEKEQKEEVLLQAYLPAQASVTMIQQAVEEAVAAVAATSIKDMGKVMKEALVKLAGQADNSQVSALVKERLSKM